MLKKIAIPVLLGSTIAAGVAEEVIPTSPAGAGTRATGAGTAVAHVAAAGSLTARAVTAAAAFKASLSSTQQDAVQYDFGDTAKQKGWSNLPTGLVARNGVKIADLSADQQAKLTALLKTVLSSQGYGDEEATRQADQYLADAQSSGNGGAQQLQYGEGLYYVAFFGTPSRSKKWTVQFGGHHLAIHMTFSGTRVDNTPFFVGVEPKAAFTENGKTYQPMEDEAKYLYGAVQSLTASQKAAAKLSQSFNDVLVGAQKDGQFPAKRVGVTVSTLSKSQRATVVKAIRAYVGDEASSAANARVRLYKKQFAKTKLAYSGTPDAETTGGYVRLHGPRLWIEISTQNGIVLKATHYHSIERDIKSDYGA